MATLTSEAEFERLYQEFVRRNGGLPTLVADQYNTPAEYYSALSSVNLSPSDLARLQAKQAQYNRSTALNTISGEIANNNFYNPYDARSTNAINNLNSITANTITITDAVTGQPIQTTTYNQLGSINSTFSPLSDSSLGGSVAVAAAVYAGVAAATGIDFGKLLLGAGLITAGVAMFTDLQNHTNEQAADIPGKMEEIDQLTGLEATFGEMSNDSCSIFNELMGIMSGAFDGVLDFIDGGIDKFKDFMNSTAVGQIFNQINGAISGVMSQINGIIDGVVGGISGAIDNIVNQITSALDPIISQVTSAFDSAMSLIDGALGGVMDMFNSLGNLADGLMSGINDMVGQIAGEIQGLIDMAANVASKLQALALAAMTLDPCKMAVLLNTGSPALADAAQQLANPIESAVSNINIPTDIDTRANPEEVQQAVAESRQQASTQPGVPQSPMNALAMIYQPFNAYLHDLIGTVQGLFGNAYELVASSGLGDVVSRVTDTLDTNPEIAELSNITNSLQGTIGDITNNITQIASGGILGTSVGSTSDTSIEDDDDFATGGAGSNAPEETYDDAILRQARQTRTEPTRTSPETAQTTRVVTENTPEGRVSRLEGPSNQVARASALWKRQYQARYGRIARDSNKLGREITRYLNDATFRSQAQKDEASLLREDVQRIRNDTASFNKTQRNKFNYRSRTQDRDDIKENEIMNAFNTVMQSENNLFLERTESELYDAQQFWNSLKGQAILG